MLDPEITEPAAVNGSLSASTLPDNAADSSITGVGGVVHCRFVNI